MLKKLLIACCLLIIAVAAKADGDQKIDSKVQKVIVFLNGAQVTRTATVNITAGISTIIFGNISPNINPQSLQVNANGDFTILSVKSEMNYLSEQVKQKSLEDLQAQQKTLQDKIALQNNLLNIDQQEEQMLIKNQLITGQNASLDIVKLKQALDFQTERLTEIKKREMAVSEQVAELNKQLQKYNQQIADITRGSNNTTSNIFVTVQSKNALQSSFTLNYVVNNARWYPTYDIRAKNINNPITIAYKANISQQSGEDWKNIKLTLSTGNPTVNNSKPNLYPYYLNFMPVIQPRSESGYARTTVLPNELTLDKTRVNGKDYAGGSLAEAIQSLPADIVQSIQVIENQTNFEFSIDNPFSVPGDGKVYTVEINQFELPAQYQYYAAPKIKADVFLTARITDWNKYNFLSGEANVFFEGTYVGKSNINPNATTDTLNLSLGVDKSIVVTRTLQKELTEKQTLGSNKKDTRNWLIDIKSHKSNAVNLLVEDQVPVSQNSAIEVETQELSGGKLDKETGKVLWGFNINPNDEKKLQLKYQVKYPKNQSVIVQ